VRRGSVDEVECREIERRDIERHVTHTLEFLNQIPWTRGYEMVPRIACNHHERCSGTGHAGCVLGDHISLQARSFDRAIGILCQEV
jgi:HD-GYP domain-containing protein (c-di-GMP phosphodiesterase class II)